MAQSGKLRLVHSVAKGPSLDVYLDGKLTLSNLGYGKFSEYLQVIPGIHALETTLHQGIDRVAGVQFTSSSGENYTAVIGGDSNQPSSIGILMVQNDKSCPQRGQAHLRVIHGAATLPSVDVYLAKDGPGKMIFRDIRYGGTGTPTYMPVLANGYKVGFAQMSSNDLLAAPQSVSLKDGQVYTLVISGTAGDIKGILMKDSSDGICYVGETQVRI